MLNGHPEALTAVRVALLPAVGFAYLSVNLHPVVAILLLLVAVAVLVLGFRRGWSAIRHRRSLEVEKIRR
jgi:hypothetical protein